ncbi:hypothetical protein WKH56_09770 [Priestia sp. SB1]|uniref:Uncharacterized protein n=1 Tax=Priestia aryabhattai TaxID=412384 RepID=A0AAX6NCW2_PRIAR|nr:hypothetical protein [Priestia aryabhattai]MDU9693763.1 hypothetical protein [Priestia aryabhattai]
MIIATIAAYIIAIVAVLGLSVRFLWLFFILFTYRTYATLIPFEWFKSIGLENHSIYFVVVLILSIATYLLLIRLTMDLTYIRYLLLLLLAIFVFYKYEFKDIFFFKDYLESKGMWNIEWYQQQFKEIFKTGPDGFAKLFAAIGDNVFSIFEKLFNGLASVFK